MGGGSDHVVDDRRANDDAGHGEDAARPDEVGNGQALSGEDDRVGRVSRGEHEGEGARHRGGEQEQERVSEARLWEEGGRERRVGVLSMKTKEHATMAGIKSRSG